MRFVSAKCPNCGAALQVAENLKSGYCNHCGSKILFEPEVSKVKIDTSKHLNNFRELALSAKRGRDHKNQLKYAEKALELNPHDSEMWMIKGEAIFQLATWSKPQAELVIECVRNTIRNAVEQSELAKNAPHYLLYCAEEQIRRIQDFKDEYYSSDREDDDLFDDCIEAMESASISYAKAVDLNSLPDDTAMRSYASSLMDYTISHYHPHAMRYEYLREEYCNICQLPTDEALKKWEKAEKEKLEEEEEMRRISSGKKDAELTTSGCIIAFFVLAIISCFLFHIFS